MKKTYFTMLFSLMVIVGMAQTSRAFDSSKFMNDNNVVKEIDSSVKKSAVQEKATISDAKVVSTSFSSFSEAMKAKNKQNSDLFAFYGRPDGLFFEGYTRDYRAYPTALLMHFPAVADVMFYPYANDQDANFKWFFNGTDTEIPAEEDGSLNYFVGITGEGYMRVPLLEASVGGESATFVLGEGVADQYGLASSIERAETEDGTIFDGLEEFPPLTLANMHNNKPASGNLYGSFQAGEAFSPSYSNENGACVGVMQVIPQLPSPMYVESMSVLAYTPGSVAMPNGGELTMELYYLTENGLGDLIAKSATDEFVVTYAPQGAFIFKFEEEEDGFITETPIVLGTEAPIAVIMTGFDSSMDFNLLFGVNDWEGSSYTLHGDDLKVSTFGYSNAPDTPIADLYIQLNGIFNVLMMYDEDDATTIEYPAEGGWGTLQNDVYPDVFVYTAYNADKGDIWIESAPEWIIGYDFDDYFYEEENMVAFYFEADELPADVPAREGQIVLASYGASLTLDVVQKGPNNVNNLLDPNVKIGVNDSGISINYPADYNRVELFNTTGQKIGDYSLTNSGEFNVPNTSNKGIYIVKLSGAKTSTVKVVK